MGIPFPSGSDSRSVPKGLIAARLSRNLQPFPSRAPPAGSSVASRCPADGRRQNYNPRQGANPRGVPGLVVRGLAWGSPLPLVAGAGGPGGNVPARGGASVFTHFVVLYLKGAVAVPERAP